MISSSNITIFLLYQAMLTITMLALGILSHSTSYAVSSLYQRHRRSAQSNSYLLNGRYTGYVNEVTVAQSRQDISVPIGRWVGRGRQDVMSGVDQAGAELSRAPGNVWRAVTGIFGIFG